MNTWRIPGDTTSKRIKVKAFDSSSTVGAGLTGLAYNTSGLVAYYIRDGQSSASAITLATATLGTWATGGFVAVDGTNMPGWYEFDLPNAVIASGASFVDICLRGAANLVPIDIHIELLPIPANMTQIDGTALSTHASGMAPADVRDIAGSAVSTTSAQLGVNVVQVGATAQTARDLGAQLDATVSSRAPEAGGNIATLVGRIVGTLAAGTHNPQSGDAYARVGAPAGASLAADVATTNGRLTATRAGYLDALAEVTAARMGALTDWIDGGRLDLLLDTVLSRLSATRAGYLDNLQYVTAAVALASELAKVPKSDSTVSWNATALAAILAQVSAALNTAIPGTPTANSINERMASMDDRLPPDPADESALEAAVAGLATLIADCAVPGDAMALTAAERIAIFARTLDTLSIDDIFKVLLAHAVGRTNGAPGGPINFRDVANTKNVIALSADADGNRSSVSLNP